MKERERERERERKRERGRETKRERERERDVFVNAMESLVVLPAMFESERERGREKKRERERERERAWQAAHQGSTYSRMKFTIKEISGDGIPFNDACMSQNAIGLARLMSRTRSAVSAVT